MRPGSLGSVQTMIASTGRVPQDAAYSRVAWPNGQASSGTYSHDQAIAPHDGRASDDHGQPGGEGRLTPCPVPDALPGAVGGCGRVGRLRMKWLSSPTSILRGSISFPSRLPKALQADPLEPSGIPARMRLGRGFAFVGVEDRLARARKRRLGP